MRCRFNVPLALFVVPLLAGMAIGQDAPKNVEVAKAKAKAALMLATVSPAKAMPCDGLCQGKCECCGDSCNCDQKTKAKALLLLKAAERVREQHDCATDFPAAFNRAKAENRVLMVWVGMTCVSAPEIRDAFPDAVHCHCDSMNGSSTPRILATQLPSPDGQFRSFPRSMFNAQTPARIREAVSPTARPGRPLSFVPQGYSSGGGSC
jgi:hypothetical protein